MSEPIDRAELAAIFHQEADFWQKMPDANTSDSFAFKYVAALLRLASRLEADQ